ncbi:MAG TPA: phasin family protein [Steroidobacteraceae bacterium]|nr:phasin family protein [Steroidobacteraceae bacterium]
MADQPNPFADVTRIIENFKLPGVDIPAMVESGRKDMEALVEANKAAYQGLQALARKQKEMLTEAMHKMQEAAQPTAAGKTPGPRPAQMAHEVYQKTLADMKELADIVRSSQAEALTKVTDRAIEHLKEIRKLINRK